MKETALREAINSSITGCQPSDYWKNHMVRQIVKGEKMKTRTKLSWNLILVIGLLLLSVTAYAVIQSVTLSPRVDAKVLANEALYEKYGLTSAMLGFFTQDTQGTDDHHWYVDYTPTDGLDSKLGSYRVEITDNHVDKITWTNEGKSTQGGFDAEAWGAEQLEEMVNITGRTHDVNRFHRKIQGEEVDLYEGMEDLTPEKTATSEENLSEEEAYREAMREQGKDAEAQSRYSREKLIELGRQGIIDAYALSQDLQNRLHFCDEGVLIPYYYQTGADEIPVCKMTFEIGGNEGWKPGDGIYTIDINVLDGTILDGFRKELEESGKDSKAQSRYTREELTELGRLGIIEAYGLNPDQQERLQFYDTSFFPAYYSTIGTEEKPTYKMTFQSSGEGGWMEGDGVYTIIVNVLDGTVEYLDYETTLDGNG